MKMTPREQTVLQHLRRNCPKMYKEMKQDGSLMEFVRERARIMDETKETLIKQGLEPAWAEEAILEELLPRTECYPLP
ncbi:MAG: hypothetical protein KatS3mg024_0967 [Armatimonadota bacterium]|nr:MAG: hypothetical protein KatS3mg024_0967 [Armatimonadota bacterium]